MSFSPGSVGHAHGTTGASSTLTGDWRELSPPTPGSEVSGVVRVLSHVTRRRRGPSLDPLTSSVSAHGLLACACLRHTRGVCEAYWTGGGGFECKGAN